MCAAWDDTLTWSARDENKDFDGVAFYPEWAGDAETAAVSELRSALADLDRALGALVDAA